MDLDEDSDTVKINGNIKGKEKTALKRSADICNKDLLPFKQLKLARQNSDIEGTEIPVSSKANSSSHIPQSPKKRLQLTEAVKLKSKSCSKEKFAYGNYAQYYGYRNKDFHDVRLDVFEAHRELFENKAILDIGCNNGFITSSIASKFNVKTIIGIDIDKSLINQAIKNLVNAKKALPFENEARKLKRYPFNVQYVHGNYVLKSDVLLEIERPQYDVILCLSITKWVQLNFGDSGLKQVFRRIFLQLNDKGCLILEAQPFKTYKKRKNINDAVRTNFNSIKFLPEEFASFLLSREIGFKEVKSLGVPEHCIEGFKRPIQIFIK